MNRSRATRSPSWPRGSLLALAALASFALNACNDSNDPSPAPLPDSTPDAVVRGATLPGIAVDIVALEGASGPGGRFRAADPLTVKFTVKKADGSNWRLSDFDAAQILVSGPTHGYQRLIPAQGDVVSRATFNSDGTYSYRFASAIPAVYAAPYNDSAAFGEVDGEKTGQAIEAGTYSVGLSLAWHFRVGDEEHVDGNTAVRDFLIGDSAAAIGSREVVKKENCNECHQALRHHDNLHHGVAACLLCHTAGAEDGNDPAIAGGTPGVSTEFRVMIHKLHNGAHLPSVLGVATNNDGSRNYEATPQPYFLASDSGVHDYSAASFPMMPSAYVGYLFNNAGTSYLGTGGNGPMPRDTGFAALSLPRKEKEDHIRTGMVACDKCHGDPDGSGVLTAPAQGSLAYDNPQRQSCGSCHDDIEWGRAYTANGQTMGAQADNNNCILCHDGASGVALGARDAHRHPYSNPTFNTGVNVTVTEIGAGSGAGGNHLAMDPISATFNVKNDAGTDLNINALTRFQMIVSGPHSNPQWVLPNVNPFDFAFRKGSPFTGNGTINTPVVGAAAIAQTIAVVFTSGTGFDVVGSTTAAQSFTIGAGSGSQTNVDFAGVSFRVTQGSTAFVANDRWYFEVVPTAASYTVNVPRDFSFERLGVADGNAQSLPAGNTPVYWGRQVVYERTALVGAPSVSTAASSAMWRYVVADASLLAGLAVGDRVVLASGTAAEEYVQVARIQTTDDVSGADLGANDRLFFTTFLRYDHGAGTSVQECTLSTRREGTDYTVALNGATGIDLLAGRFAAGNPVVLNYRSDARFGYRRAAGEAWQNVYTPPTGDSDEIGAAEGDWTGLPLVDGTYTFGIWSNIDFTVNPLGAPVTTEAWNNLASDNTTYRMMAPPATRPFLFGAATTLTPRAVIADSESCNKCHGDIAAHGFGRRGLDTCMLCHASPGAEDAPLYQFNGWYVGATPRVSMDFRELLHKVHMGRELSNASSYVANGIFLGTPYPVHYGEIAFPVMPTGVTSCTSCHGVGSNAWKQPSGRDHPSSTVAGTREWTAVCSSCHDSSAALAHIATMGGNGQESCAVCHGTDGEWNVELMHKRY
ncbi:MAG: hypothetical protein IT457_02640 [Planctomycetes bacterium]|nr:hypothetical protein [Planctomycetota bacterium]